MKSSWMKVFHKGQQFPKVLWDGCKISHIFISGHDPFCFLLKYSTRLVHSQHGRPLENQRVVLCVKESSCLFLKSKRSTAMEGGGVQQRALLVLAGQVGHLGTGQEPLYIWSDLRKMEPFLRAKELSQGEMVQGMVPSLGQYKAGPGAQALCNAAPAYPRPRSVLRNKTRLKKTQGVCCGLFKFSLLFSCLQGRAVQLGIKPCNLSRSFQVPVQH